VVRQKRGEGALGRAIRVARTQRGLNRKELAERSELSYAYVSEIESGRKTPSARALGAIAGALEVAPHELMEAAEAMSGPGDASWFSPRHSFFLRRAEKAAPGALRFPAGVETEKDGDLLAELVAAARRLSADDLRALVDLARRLGRGGDSS
jgi:transcriptional regulator with XRE-family HTH domain